MEWTLIYLLIILLFVFIVIIGVIVRLTIIYLQKKNKQESIINENSKQLIDQKNNNESELDSEYQKIQYMDEEEFIKEYELHDSNDILKIEKYYDNFVNNYYDVCESNPLTMYYVYYIRDFIFYSFNEGGIITIPDFMNIREDINFHRMKEITFSRKMMGDIFSIPSNNIQNDIHTLNEAYCILYENIIKDEIHPKLKLFIDDKLLTSKGNIINQLKKLKSGYYLPIVKYFNNTIRNAISHHGVYYNIKNKKIRYYDEKSKKEIYLSPQELHDYVINLFNIMIAFDYNTWKISEPIDRKLIKGAKIVKTRIKDWKLVPTDKDIEPGEISFGQALLNIADVNEENR